MEYIKAGDILHLDLEIGMSIDKDTFYDPFILKMMIEGVVRSYFKLAGYVDFKRKYLE